MIRRFWDRFGGIIGSFLKIVLTLGSVVVLLGLFFGWFEEKPDTEEVDALKDLRGKVEVLYRYVDEVSGKPTVSYDLLLKDPFMDTVDLEWLLEDMVEKDKEKVKEETGDKYWGSEFEIYTRKLVYEKSLNAPFKATYGHKDGYELTTQKRLSNYRNHELRLNYSPMYVTYDNDGNEKKVMYNEKDYEKFLRLMELIEVTDGNYETGLMSYVVHDLGIEYGTDEYYEVYRKWDKFFTLGYDTGEPMNMYNDMRDYLFEVYKSDDKKMYRYLYEMYGDPNEF